MALDATAQLALLAPTLSLNANAPSYIAAAREELSSCFFGSSYEKAVALLAAHTMTLALDPIRAGGVGGAVTSKREGQLSISFNAPNGDSDYSQTSYGIQLLRLMNSRSGMFVTGGYPSDGC